MNLCGWRLVRQRMSSSNYQFDEHVISSHKVHQALAFVTSQSFLVPIRAISSAVINRTSADGAGSKGPKDPAEVSSGQDEVVPEGAEDKRMWRKWIEERLAQSGSAGEEIDASPSGNSRVGETVTSSRGPAPRSKKPRKVLLHQALFFRVKKNSQVLFLRLRTMEKDLSYQLLLSLEKFSDKELTDLYSESQLPEWLLVRWTDTYDVMVYAEGSSAGKRLSPLDSIFRTGLKPGGDDGTAEDSRVSNLRNPFRRENVKYSFFPERPSKKNAMTGDRRSPLLQEAAKQPSFFSGRQAPSNSPQASLDNLPVEALDDFEYRVLGSPNDEGDPVDDDFLRDLDEIGRSARGMKNEIDDDLDVGEDEDWSDDKAKVLTDLALSNMEIFDLEDEENPYRMRSDRLFFPGQTYDPEDLDLSKEAALEKPTVRTRKRYPSKEVFQVADFRNPRYLSKFIRESSRILPRRHYQISAKAQRKVAREIKTARILGLMPFTSMGDPPFRFLRSRSEFDTNTGFDDY